MQAALGASYNESAKFGVLRHHPIAVIITW